MKAKITLFISVLLTSHLLPVFALATLPQTGQTKCYDPAGAEIACMGTGQDGEIRAGIPWPDSRFSVSGDCVTDNLTGLIWPVNGNLAGSTKTWGDAIDYSNNLTLCGYSDWRLPNINELDSLVHSGEQNIGAWLNTQGFSDIQSGYHWSSTTYANSTSGAKSVDFLYGRMTGVTKTVDTLVHALPVRGESGGSIVLPKTGQTVSYAAGDDGDLRKGAAWPVPRFQDSGDGTVTDNLTGLIWLKDANCINWHYSSFDADGTAGDGKVSWEHALEFVAGINNGTYANCGGGYGDWRLPNRKELLSLVDSSTYSLPLDHPFTHVAWYSYWTSTTYPGGMGDALTVRMDLGVPSSNPKASAANYVWPVRGGLPDTTPDQFTFIDQTGAALNTEVASNAATIAGIDTPSQLSISGGEYSVSTDGGATWSAFSTTTPSSVSLNDQVKLRLTSSDIFSTTATATLTIGGVTGQFSVTTLAADTAPDSFTFTEQTDISLNTASTSNAVTVTGVNTGAPVWISACTSTLCQYSVNGGAYTSSAGTVNYGDAVTVRQSSSPDFSTTTNLTLSIGGASGTFSVTTMAMPTYTLAVNTAGNGNGTASGAGTYDHGVTATVTASPGLDSDFIGWSGDCTGTGLSTTASMTDDRTCTATFNLKVYTLTVNTEGNGNGTVSGAGTYDHGTAVTATASPDPDSDFAFWSGDCSGTDLSTTISMTGNKSCTATFTPKFFLPDTGQTLCYDAASNEIACTDIGISAGQDGCYYVNPMSFIDNGDGTVKDNNTRLMWQQQDDGNMYNWYQANGMHEATYNPDATDVCGNLGLGGYSDWRLPTKKELITIVDYSIPWPGPAIDTTYFPGTKSSDYWSANTSRVNQNFAWHVGFGFGKVAAPVNNDSSKSNGMYVRCVRGGQYDGPDLVDNGDGTVKDHRTGLIWQKQSEPELGITAISYCEELTLGGHTDWRLPNIKELTSIIDDTRSYPSINTSFFPNSLSNLYSFENYWSSTNYLSVSGGAWTVGFIYGEIEGYSTDVYGYARCVRGGKVAPYDATPDQFSFVDRTDAPRGVWVVSEPVEISGIDVPAPISIGGQGQYSINGGEFTPGEGTVKNGDTVRVRVYPSNSYSTTTSATLTIYGVSDTFSVTTPDLDTIPDQFTFNDQTGVELNTRVISNSITVSGINGPVPISVMGGEYSINGGAYTAAPKLVYNGGTVVVRQTSSSNFSAKTDLTLDIGGVVDTFSVTTFAADNIPEPFTFTDRTNVPASTRFWSNAITVSGINTTAPVSVVGGEYSINGGLLFSTPGTVQNGDTVTVWLNSSPLFSTTTSATLTIAGVSDTFSVTTAPAPAAYVAVASPNGGERWPAGSTQTIRWAHGGDIGTNLKIELLRNGASPLTIASSVPTGSGGVGSMSWTVPATLTPGEYNWIRITSSCLYSDSSDTDFSITAPTITVAGPNGGESWSAGSTQTIRWSYTGNPGAYVKIDLLRNGVLDRTIASSVSKGSGGVGSKSWTVPATLAPGDDYRIRITSTSNSAYGDTSDTDFSFVPPTITVTEPNGGDPWSAGSTRTIRWTYTGNPGRYVKIELLKKGVLSQTIASSVPKGSGGAGSRAWTVPAALTPGNDYRIRVTSTLNRLVSDTSDTDFSIVPPTITVTAPNGGDPWSAGSTRTIRWTYTGNPGAYVRIELLKNGVVSRTIASSVPKGSSGAGAKSWTVPATLPPGGDYKIRIISTSNSAIKDDSDNNFSIDKPD